MKASGPVPRLTSRSTLVRPERRAASTAACTWAGVVTACWLTERIRSARCRPFSAASLLGSTGVITTPRAVAGRLSALAICGLSGCSERPRTALPGVTGVFSGVSGSLSLPSWRASSSSVGRWPTVTRDGLALAVADDVDRYLRADRGIGDDEGERLVGRHVAAIDRRMTSPCWSPARAAGSFGWMERTISPRSFGRPSEFAISSSSGWRPTPR